MHKAWVLQIKGLIGIFKPNNDEEATPADATADYSNEKVEASDGIEVCCFDNCRMGQSSVPLRKLKYSMAITARNALALLDHLECKKAHVFGHAMSDVIACKLAAMKAERLLSLALRNATGGGFECFPKVDYQITSIAFHFQRAKTAQESVVIDLEMNYTKEYLDKCVGLSITRKALYQIFML